VVLDRSQWHLNFKNGWIITGLIAGLAGVILLLTQKSSAKFEQLSFTQLKAILVIIGGSFLWALGSLRLRSSQARTSVYSKTSIHLLAAGLFAFLISLVVKEHHSFHLKDIRPDAVISLLLLSVVSTTFTFMAFIWLIQQKPVAVVSTYSYVNPVVAVLLGVFIKGEPVSGIQVIAMLITLSGVLFVNIPGYKFKPGRFNQLSGKQDILLKK
jgi:drug/metabolite transporter (DMT)-like permease